MARILKQVTTSSGTTWQRKEDSLGREYTYKEGEGRVADPDSRRFAAAKSHTTLAEYKRGHIDRDEIDRSDLQKPFNTTTTDSVEKYERGSFEREQAAEVNRFFGFLTDNRTPDDRVEAALEYQEFEREIRDKSGKEAEKVRRKYNIGGSG